MRVEERELVIARSGGLCEICGKFRATEIHHRKHKSQGGSDRPENLLHVCGWGNHTGCHGLAHTDEDRYKFGWAIRSGVQRPAEVEVLYRGQVKLLDQVGRVLDQLPPLFEVV